MTKSSIIKEFFLLIPLLFSAYAVAVNKALSSAVLDGVNLFIASIFPALFPYLFITAFLGNLSIIKKGTRLLSPLSNKIFRCKGIVFYAYFISLLSGYPMGSKTVSDLRKAGLLTKSESVRASCLCSTSSPMFLIGCVGNLMFNNSLFGVFLFITHLVSSIVIGFIFSFYKEKEEEDNQFVLASEKASSDFFAVTVKNALSDILFVGAVITLFYVITEALLEYNLLLPVIKGLNLVFNEETLSKGITFGLFECTKGLKALSLGKINLFTLPIVASITGFGGFSVIMQSLPFLKSAKIKIAPFLFSKLVAIVINFIVGLILSSLLF